MRGFRNALLLFGLIFLQWFVRGLFAMFSDVAHLRLSSGSHIAIMIVAWIPDILAGLVVGACAVAFDSPRKLHWVTALAAVLAAFALMVSAVSWKLYAELSVEQRLGVLVQAALTVAAIYTGFAAARAVIRRRGARMSLPAAPAG
jgi:hypothetical protein